jgi:hypothetical protein
LGLPKSAAVKHLKKPSQSVVKPGSREGKEQVKDGHKTAFSNNHQGLSGLRNRSKDVADYGQLVPFFGQ